MIPIVFPEGYNQPSFQTNPMKALDNTLGIIADLQKQVSLLNERLQQIVSNAPAPAPEPSAEVMAVVKKRTNKTFGDNLGFWTFLLGLTKGDDQYLLWRNGVVTTYGQTNTKNPIAVFASRHKARLMLRKAGWDVPYAFGGLNCGKYVVATRK